MDNNPDLKEIDKWLGFWRDRSLSAMVRHRVYRHNQIGYSVTRSADPTETSLKNAEWEKLNDRKGVTLAFK